MTDHTARPSDRGPNMPGGGLYDEISENPPFILSGHRMALSGHRIFVRVIAAFFVVFLLWASFSQIDRVTRGSGRIVSQEKNNFVQHYEGGIIAQILIAEGDRVREGDVLLRIENSFAKAELANNALELVTEKIRKSRLLAETQEHESFIIDPLLAKNYPLILAQERQYFDSRRAELTEQLLIAEDQIAQKRLEYSEKEKHLQNKLKEKSLMLERLSSLRRLTAQGAVSRNALLEDEMQYQQTLTRIEDLEYQIPQSASAVEEATRKKRELVLKFKKEADRALTETEFRIEQLQESIAALKDRKQRFDVVAPTDGTINKLFVNNINGVVRPGQNIAEIVPDDAPIEVEARLRPRDRAEIWPGLPVVVKVSAYDFSIYGGLEGKIVEISPDALQDEEGQTYFRVRIEAAGEGFGENAPVIPGMLADVDIITGQRTILDYLLKPIRRVKERAFRE